MEFLKEHWEKTLIDNENLIINNSMQIVMAEEVIKLVKKKLKTFPREKLVTKDTKILPVKNP